MSDRNGRHESDAGSVTPGAARQALAWLMRIQSGEFSSRQRQDWQRWRAANPAHESAWQRIEQVNQRLGGLGSAPVAMHALDASGRVRRRNLKLLGGLVGTSLLAFGAREAYDFKLGGDYLTGIGEVQAATLPDGSRLVLNTDSAVDVGVDEQGLIQVTLRRGEIMLSTAPGLTRPVQVMTSQGGMQSADASILVREQDDACRAGVLAGTLDIWPAGARQSAYQLSAGQQAVMRRTAIEAPVALPAHASAWTEGMLIAVDMPLAHFLDELGRYRRGVLRCAPEVADWRISGSYPLADTDKTLQALMAALPVTVQRRTRYWVTVGAR